MADYHSVLQRAIANLPQNSGQARREIYDKARKALVRQLESFDPPLPPAEITAQRLALEEAIRRIETDVVRRGAPPRPAPAERAPAAPAPVPAAPAPAPVPAPVAAPAPAPRPAAPVRPPVAPRPAPAEVAPPADEPPVTPRPRPRPPVAAPPVAAPPVEPVEPMRAEPPAPLVRPPVADPVVPPAPVAEVRPPRPEPMPEPMLPVPDDLAAPEPAPLPDADPEPAPVVRPRRADAAPKPARAPRERAAGPNGASRPVPPPAPVPEEPSESWAYAEDGRALPATRDFDPRIAEDEDGLYSDALVDEPASPRRVRPVRAPGNADFAPRARAAAPARSGASRNRLARMIALGAVVVVLLGASVGAVYYLAPSGPPADAPQSAEQTGTPATPPADGSAAAPPAATDGQAGKIPDRLEDDVKRVPTRRIVTTAPEGAAEGDPAAPAPAEGESAATPTVPMPPAATDAPPEPAATMSATGDRAILYEEGAAQGSRGSAAVGKVSWSLVQESFANGPKEPMVRANVTIPERKTTVGLLFRQNHDPALPASYLVEITFELPDNFPGGGVSNVPGLVMKASEDARGDALLGASARVSDGLFWIALAQSPTDVARNNTLMRERNWIDIPMLYTSGRRAILTIEKGPEGNKALDAALTAWAKKGG